MNIIKIITATLIIALFLWCDYDPFHHSFLHMINFPIHEIGHVIFRSFGEFMMILGGSLFQILLPIIFFFYFLARQEFFSVAVIILWIGNNFFDVAMYIRDAVYMELPLANPFAPNGTELKHDWNYLLTSTNMLMHSDLIANIFIVIGSLITITGIIGLYYFSINSEPKDNLEF